MTDPIKVNVRVLADRLDPDRALAKLKKVVTRWAYSEGLEIVAIAAPDVPVDTGAMKSTGIAEKPVEENGTILCRIGYGGVAGPPWNTDVGYAFHVHEDLDAYHEQGRAKFLEIPFVQRKPTSLEILEQMIRGLL